MHTKRIQSLSSYPPIAFTHELAREMLRESVRFWVRHASSAGRIAKAKYREAESRITPVQQELAAAWEGVDWTAPQETRETQYPPQELRNLVARAWTRLAVIRGRRERLCREGRALTLASAYLRGTPFSKCEDRKHSADALKWLAGSINDTLNSLWQGAYPLHEKRAIRQWLETT